MTMALRSVYVLQGVWALALIVGTPGDTVTLEVRNGVVVEGGTRRARRINFAGDLANFPGCYHTGIVLLSKPLRFLRHYVCDAHSQNCLHQQTRTGMQI